MALATTVHRHLEHQSSQDFQAPSSPLGFCAVYQGSSRCEIRSKSSDWAVVLQLQKTSTTDPFRGLDWTVSCGSNRSSVLSVTKQLFAKDTIFRDADGLILTRMTQGLLSDHAEFVWGAFTYRWTRIRGTRPLKLQLHNATTQERVACLQGCLSMPRNSARPDYITVMTSSRDIRWLQLVIASGMAEANCLGSEHFLKQLQ